MTRKLKLTAFLCSFALLSVYIILPCFEMTSGLALASNAVSTRVHRHLKTLSLSTVDESRGRVEERGSGSVLTTLSEKLSGFLKNLRELFDRLMMRISPKWYLAGASDQEMAISRLFYRFGVDEVKDDLFKSVQYKRWASVIYKATQMDPSRGRVAMYSKLAAHFSDAQLVRFFKEAYNRPIFAHDTDLAHIFEFYQWYLRTKAVDGVESFDADLSKIIFFRAWILSVTWFGKGEAADHMLLAKLAKRFGDHAMANLRMNALEDNRAAKIAATVSGVSHEGLMRFRNDALELLQYLPRSEYDRMAERPVSFRLTLLKTADPEKFPFFFSRLREHLGDKQMAELLVDSEKNYGEFLSPDLEKELFKIWRMEDQSLYDIFTRLGLDSDLIESSALSTWVSYALFEAKRTGRNTRELMLDVVKKSYDNMAEDLVQRIDEKVLPRVREALDEANGRTRE